ncbi:type 2 lanthipeptide synthetase LanM [Salininema proteolyticum]|uniref:Type 2 lanthipeptide synthetase LanM n=1 Tax=Salininema proteolyticum TaxID=1607685 RepID=A0ABV8TV15_9ACTN
MPTSNDTLVLAQAAALHERRPGSTTGKGADAATDAWARRLLEEEGTLDAYLSRQGLDRDGLAALLSGGSWTPRPGSTDWLARADEWLLRPTSHHLATGPLVIEGSRVEELPFPGLLGPVVAEQADHLDRWSWLTEEARAGLLDRLAERLATLSLRCLVTDLARDTAEGAYERLDTALSKPDERLRFYARYPVLAKDLTVGIANWRAQVERILDRLVADADALADADLLPCDYRTLRDIELATGDSHEAGQTVAILRFTDGHRLVYKPRDCSVFTLYRDTLDALAPMLPLESRLHAPIALVRPEYGWVEHIAHATGTTDPGTYLRKLGGLLAIAHVFGSSDLHLENVIASPAGPVPVDLETLVQNRSGKTDTSVAAQVAVRRLNESVLGTGILPVQLTAGEDTSIDVSVSTGGLKEDTGYATAHQLVDPCTDRMRIEAVETPIGKAKNQPPGMTAALVRAHRTALSDGFAETYRAVLTQRTRLREILTEAPDMTVRHIVRATRSYSLLLTEMRQPGRLRSGIDRDHLLRSLWVRLAEHPDEADLIRAEEQAIRRLDVPLFSTGLDTSALHTDGHEIAPGYFERTTRDDVLHRLDDLSENAIAESRRIIDESILAATPAQERTEPPREAPLPERASDSEAALRRAAREQGELLVDTAILGQDDATWISVCSSTDSTGLEYRPIGPTLYDGLAGIAFAATYAHEVLPDLGLDDLAHRTVHAVAAILDDWAQDRVELPIGAFSGAAGLLYAIAHYDSRLGGDRYRKLRAAAVRRLATASANDKYLDVMAGTAGAIAVIAALPEVRTDYGREALRALADRLIERGVDAGDGSLAWETGTARARLGGFSHGATGIGWTLAKAAALLDDDGIATAARRALQFDDTLFDPTRHRWLDVRPESVAQGKAFPAHWCHGASGIAMARASAATLLKAPELLDLAVLGAQETTRDVLPSDDSLCHGTLGNLLAMRETARHVSTDIGLDGFRNRVIDRLDREAPRSGLPQGITTVRGLLLGTAGSMYALCRELRPSIPNALLLDGPPER